MSERLKTLKQAMYIGRVRRLVYRPDPLDGASAAVPGALLRPLGWYHVLTRIAAVTKV